MSNSINIPDYILEKKCGRGAYGDVWMAQDLSYRQVALKLIDKTMPFDRELSGLCACQKLHDVPGLIRILHIGETEEFFYYTMELADSLTDDHYTPATLSNILKTRHRLTAPEVIALGEKMLTAIDFLHRKNIIHRDIKPENIMLVNGEFKLSDVGLMRPLSHSLTLAGTLGFIPPEKLLADSGSQSFEDDLYAMGKVLYCAWTGNPVENFPSIPLEVTASAADRQLNRIITRACSRNPRKRFASAAAFLAALKSGEAAAPRWKKIAMISGAVLLILLLAAGVFFFAGKAGTQPETPPAASTSTVPQEPPAPAGFRNKPVLLVKNRFDETELWKIADTPDIVRSENDISIKGSFFRGKLRLDFPLPEYFRITFDIDLTQLPVKSGITFVSSISDDSRVFISGFGGHSSKAQIRQLFFVNSAGNEVYYPTTALTDWGHHRLEITRTPEGLTVKLDGKTLQDNKPIPGGNEFYFQIHGEIPGLRIYNFHLYRLD